jgi:hypothetical protein
MSATFMAVAIFGLARPLRYIGARVAKLLILRGFARLCADGAKRAVTPAGERNRRMAAR